MPAYTDLDAFGKAVLDEGRSLREHYLKELTMPAKPMVSVSCGTYLEEIRERQKKLEEAVVCLQKARKQLEAAQAARATWEAARNKDSDMLDYQNSEGYQQQYMSGYYGENCGHGGSCSSGGTCSGDGCNPRQKVEDLKCTCSDDQYAAVCATGKGFSDTCPYHTAWAKERLRKERGL